MGNEENAGFKLVNLLPEKVVEKAYDDAGSKAAQQIGKLSEDTLKAFRLFTAPIQLLGAFQDRLERWMERIRAAVPPERQTESPPEIAGPVIERLKYVGDGNPLQELYLNLLTRSIDKERQSEAHPAFVRIIEQLAPDEAVILGVMEAYSEYAFQIRSGGIAVIRPTRGLKNAVGIVELHLVIRDQILAFPERVSMYFSHLDGLGLATYGFFLEEGISFPFLKKLQLTDFGKLFVAACVPPKPALAAE
jgi:hypothetical protein